MTMMALCPHGYIAVTCNQCYNLRSNVAPPPGLGMPVDTIDLGSVINRAVERVEASSLREGLNRKNITQQ